MKVGKRDLGLLAAVEQWVVRDHQAGEAWEERLQKIVDVVVTTTVQTSIRPLHLTSFCSSVSDPRSWV